MIDFPSSPANGQIVTGPNGTTWFWNGSAWRLGSSVPAGARGRIAYAETITQQTGITSTLVDVAGLTVTFTAVAGRTYKVTAAAALGCTAIQPGSIRIYLDGAQVQNSLIAIPTGDNNPYRADCEYVTSALTAGSHTFKIMAGLIGATGTMTVMGHPLYPNFILVEDITYEAWSGGGSTPSSGVSLGHSASQSIPNNVATAVTFDTEFYDTAGYHTTGSRITIPEGQDGRYLVGYTSSFFAVAGGTSRNGFIRKNGNTSERTAASMGFGSASYNGQLGGQATLDLVAGDYIEHFVWHDQGAAQSLQGNNSAGHLLEFYAVKMTGSGSGGGGGGGSGFTYIQETAPTPAKAGDTWFNSSTGAQGGVSYVAIDRGSGVLVWVQFSPGLGSAPPAAGIRYGVTHHQIGLATQYTLTQTSTPILTIDMPAAPAGTLLDISFNAYVNVTAVGMGSFFFTYRINGVNPGNTTVCSGLVQYCSWTGRIVGNAAPVGVPYTIQLAANKEAAGGNGLVYVSPNTYLSVVAYTP